MKSPNHRTLQPFEVSVTKNDIDYLKSQIKQARWPDQSPDVGWEYGTNRGYLRNLCEYWCQEYNWNRFEDRLNKFEQYLTTVDGQQIHFYHIRSPEPAARPLLLSHGWPGSIVEFIDVFSPLSDPAAHGGDPKDAFHIVAPSIPGYGFSGPTNGKGYGIRKVANAFGELMKRLGYDTFFAQGGDWGGLITAILGAKYPSRVDAIHMNLLFVKPSTLSNPMGMLDKPGREDYEESKEFRANEWGYYEIQSTKPQTLAYGLNDSPIGLAGWIIEKFHTWSDCHDNIEERFDRDRLLDNINVYWLTQTINSSMRLYYETDDKSAIPNSVNVPTGHARYPAEVIKTPRVWAEEVYDMIYWNELPEGGHFAAMEVPDLFVEDIRAFFREVR